MLATPSELPIAAALTGAGADERDTSHRSPFASEHLPTISGELQEPPTGRPDDWTPGLE